MKKGFTVFLALMILFITACCAGEGADRLTYAVYPLLPDPAYYQELIERRRAQMEPDLPLIRAEWNCYEDGAPEGIDIIMFDAVMLDSLAASGWIQPISPDQVRNTEDIFPFALEGLTVEGRLYGIPVFLCGNFLIYDQTCESLARAEHITDVSDRSEILVVNSEDPMNRPQYIIEVIADRMGMANPSVDVRAEDALLVLDRLAIGAHKRDDNERITLAYDAGEGLGYIGFSESMRLLKHRAADTRIKTISFSDRPDIRRLYVDAAAVSAEVRGERLQKCLELMNVMAEAKVLTALSVQDGAPQYLLLPRKSPYPILSERFPLYAQLEGLAGAETNHVIRTR